MVPATLNPDDIKKEPSSTPFVEKKVYEFKEKFKFQSKFNDNAGKIPQSRLPPRKREYPFKISNNYSLEPKEKHSFERNIYDNKVLKSEIKKQILSKAAANQFKTKLSSNYSSSFTPHSSMHNTGIGKYEKENSHHFDSSKFRPSFFLPNEEQKIPTTNIDVKNISEINPLVSPQTYFSQTSLYNLIYNQWVAAAMSNCSVYKSATANVSTPFSFPYYPFLSLNHASDLAMRNFLLSSSFPLLQRKEERPHSIQELSTKPQLGFSMSELIETKPKRVRTTFKSSQLDELEKAFQKSHYLIGNERELLAKTLTLSQTQIKVWFQNRRTKHKNENKFADE